ncbi:Similar to S.cerevisiae protein VMA5 (Subunit C of the V1 peripheral membrane domain of V-ATPase) [Malassezia sympodialis ATCC 42132]|uniref:V-type proton ATPase subunit C n=1 Tax=Malassezia sympodialis (strain ATCC 42132) TaxID=1230383 RepID=A0A1M8ABZ4_MALS4|nr:Similar to S.cerevisiae protein VMA5 (Subunit C of the V1 peripheral membrane domain of V-ATPase) [Malassezia sympodialis ATCC 42132]
MDRTATRMPSESSYWIVSVPVQEEKSTEQMHRELVSRLVRDSACEEQDLAPLPLPELKTGTLESLIIMAEDLPKIDALFGSITTRIVDTLRALVNDDEEALNEHLLIDGQSVEDYLLSWHWHNGKYRADKSLNEIVERLTREMQSIDHVMKQKLNTYNAAKGQLQQLERKKHGNLSVCSLADIVSRDDLVDPSSEFLVTLLVVVPKNQASQWLNSYERLCDLVVPRSSRKLAEDEEYALFNVTVFRKKQDEFVQKCREVKGQVRDFTWDEGLLERERQELYEAGASEKELWTELLRLSRTHFADAYQALIHFKVVRTFVESVLRFGLPATYFTVVIEPTPRKAKTILTSLTSHFGYLDEYLSRTEKGHAADAQAHQDTPGEFANLLEQEVFPFVLTEQPMITV